MNKIVLLLPLLLLTGCTQQIQQYIQDENITCVNICQTQTHPSGEGFTWNITGEPPANCNCQYYFNTTKIDNINLIDINCKIRSVDNIHIKYQNNGDSIIKQETPILMIYNKNEEIIETISRNLSNTLVPDEIAYLSFDVPKGTMISGEDYMIKLKILDGFEQIGYCTAKEEISKVSVNMISTICNATTNTIDVTIQNTGTSKINSGLTACTISDMDNRVINVVTVQLEEELSQNQIKTLNYNLTQKIEPEKTYKIKVTLPGGVEGSSDCIAQSNTGNQTPIDINLSCNNSVSDTTSIIVPGQGNHNYKYYFINLSEIPVGSSVELTVQTGSGDASTSVDLFPPGANILTTGYQTDDICNIYDQSRNTIRTTNCIITNPGIYTLGVEGNWFSPITSTNNLTFTLKTQVCKPIEIIGNGNQTPISI